MITGAHLLLYSNDPEADRKFFRDVLGLPTVDAGGGWLIFGLPPAELGVHPAPSPFVQRHADHDILGAVLYFMCDDLESTTNSLAAKGVACTEVEKAEWGVKTTVRLPSGGEVGLYQPSHPTALTRRG
jgi:catechol 2,3-dioxygenase-like lactoylglutathione lyase family enzyme